MPRLAIIARDPLPIREAALAWLPAGVPVTRCQGTELSLELIFEQLSGGDLFGSQQAFWYQDFFGLKLGPKDGKRLAAMLASLPASTSLVVSQVLDFEQDWEEKKKLETQAYTNWVDGAPVQDFRQLSTPAKAPGWLAQRAQELYGLKLTPAQAQRLLAVSDNRLVLADSELSKLALLKTSDALQPVPDTLLNAVLSTNPAAEYLEMVDGLMTGARDAVTRLQTWFKATPETYRLVYELRTRLLALRDQAAGKRLPFFQSSKIQSCARYWRPPAIDTALLALARMEYALKSGQYTGLASKEAELAALELLALDLRGALKA
jgi:DNA polymerase III delta subunit